MRHAPAYCINKTRNLAFVRLGGRMIYLGQAHSPESHERPHEVIAAHYAPKPTTAATPRRKPSTFTVAEFGPGGHPRARFDCGGRLRFESSNTTDAQH
jgi:hypothetical protein